MEEKNKGKQREERSEYIIAGGLLEEIQRRTQEEAQRRTRNGRPADSTIKSEIVADQSPGNQAENLVEEPIKATLPRERPSRKTISPAKLEANQRNAKRSTGPRTDRGKRSSRRNAMRHGILTSTLLISDGRAEEDAAEFQQLLCTLRKDLEPVGELEEMMVEMIAICSWRLQRGLRFEAQAIQRASQKLAEGKGERGVTTDPGARLAELLSRAAARLAARAPKSPMALPSESEENSHSQEHAATPNPAQSQLSFRQSEPELFSLPSEKDLNRILRYETSIHRQLAFAMNQLERLQRARKGDHIPAPVNLQVSSNE